MGAGPGGAHAGAGRRPKSGFEAVEGLHHECDQDPFPRGSRASARAARPVPAGHPDPGLVRVGGVVRRPGDRRPGGARAGRAVHLGRLRHRVRAARRLESAAPADLARGRELPRGARSSGQHRRGLLPLAAPQPHGQVGGHRGRAALRARPRGLHPRRRGRPRVPRSLDLARARDGRRPALREPRRRRPGGAVARLQLGPPRRLLGRDVYVAAGDCLFVARARGTEADLEVLERVVATLRFPDSGSMQ